MKKNSKNLKSSNKRTNKINNKKRSSVRGYYTGGKEIPPKWKEYGYRKKDYFIQDRQEQLRIERLEREMQKVLTNIIIQSIMIIMNDDQAERFQTYIRENIRIEDNIQNHNQMIHEFVIQAVELLDDEQRLLTRRVINAVQQERIERVRMNQPFGRQQILDTIERVVRENMGAIARNSGGGRGYYKRYTRKKISNRK
jgi:hypothetical protein